MKQKSTYLEKKERKAKREMKSIAFDCSKIETDGCFKRNQREINKEKKEEEEIHNYVIKPYNNHVFSCMHGD